MIRVAAVTVLVALAALAAYTVFSGPTTVAVPAKRTPGAAPAHISPTGGEPGEGQEGGGGD